MKTREETSKIAHKALDLFWTLRDECYDDEKSNEIFDEHHDNLMYQCMGLDASIDSFDSDNDNDIDGWYKEFTEALDLAEELEDFREKTNDIGNTNFNWIYG